jgi:hypothetical protein
LGGFYFCGKFWGIMLLVRNMLLVEAWWLIIIDHENRILWKHVILLRIQCLFIIINMNTLYSLQISRDTI